MPKGLKYRIKEKKNISILLVTFIQRHVTLIFTKVFVTFKTFPVPLKRKNSLKNFVVADKCSCCILKTFGDLFFLEVITEN